MAFIEIVTAIGLKEVVARVKSFFKYTDEWVSMNQHDFSKSRLKIDLEKEGYILRFATKDKIEGHKSRGYEIIRRTDRKNKKVYMYNDGRGSILIGKKRGDLDEDLSSFSC